MNRLGTEEKAALLLAEVDEDDEFEMTPTVNKPNNDKVTVLPKRTRTRNRRDSDSSNVILCFGLIVTAFVLGCLSGVIIMFYRISQENSRGSMSTNFDDPFNKIKLDVDLKIKKNLFQSIHSDSFVKANYSNTIELITYTEIYEKWKSFPSEIVRINQLMYDIKLSKYSPSQDTNIIELIDSTSNKVLIKIDAASKAVSMFDSSLVASGKIESSTIYYANYGREEDFAHLYAKQFFLQESDKIIMIMRRNPSIITVTEQIRQAINYRSSALILFDDHENDQTTTVNQRISLFEKWRRYTNSEAKERDLLLDGIYNNQNKTIPVLTVNLQDIYNVFGLIQAETAQWLSLPTEWYKNPIPIKLAGTLSNFKIRVSVEVQDVTIQLPTLMAFIRGSVDQDHFILVGFQINSARQNKIINELIQSYSNQIKQGWTPKRSILFCGWSGAEYDHYAARRWLSENIGLVDRYLIAYLDLGNDLMGNGTLNLHGSSLLEQVAHNAADFVPSPLVHDHICHHRQPTTTMSMTHDENGEHHHDHGRRRRDGDHAHSVPASEAETSCEPHKLLDEWIKVTKNQEKNSTMKIPNIVQSIDSNSLASLFQLKYGIPSLIIEMSNAEDVSKEKFYTKRSFGNDIENIQSNVYVAYTQFVGEVIRQLCDEPLIPFNLTFYADQINNQTSEYLRQYSTGYDALSSHIDQAQDFNETISKLTKTIREIQRKIDEMPKNDWIRLSSVNKKIFEFERVFIFNEPLKPLDIDEKKSKHILLGDAIGLTDTSVPFPTLSNILYEIPHDPPEQLCDASKLNWIRFRQHIDSARRTLTGIESLLNKMN